MIENVQTVFLRRLRAIYELDRSEITRPTVRSLIERQSVRTLFQVYITCLMSNFFQLRQNNLRNQSSVIIKEIARVDTITNNVSFGALCPNGRKNGVS